MIGKDLKVVGYFKIKRLIKRLLDQLVEGILAVSVVVDVRPGAEELDLDADVVEGADDGPGDLPESAVRVRGVEEGHFHPAEGEEERRDGSRDECVGRPRAGESRKLLHVGHLGVGAELQEKRRKIQ
ncbi:hypothetical protein AVEN_96205-1 [Araneus ventricosus]|uniref:Uncharacterized protein n=1 Tax=Araneus ventricosus TaxID=182803 RepID=A0A4Y2I4M1_ARAVE|nr:hypothetical protein AVEN_96205-1 [Araneus ventricosus]